MTEPTTHTLDVPGAVLTYDVRRNEASPEPVLLLIGSPADYADRPAPDPTMFGPPTEDGGSRNDVLLGQNIVSCTHYQIDFDALRAASTSIVIAAGTESEGELACRATVAVAERLGTKPVTFPSGHGGFLGDEYGQPGEPEAFAATRRRVLGRDGSGRV